jgi:hypothetical protein
MVRIERRMRPSSGRDSRSRFGKARTIDFGDLVPGLDLTAAQQFDMLQVD